MDNILKYTENTQKILEVKRFWMQGFKFSSQNQQQNTGVSQKWSLIKMK